MKFSPKEAAEILCSPELVATLAANMGMNIKALCAELQSCIRAAGPNDDQRTYGQLDKVERLALSPDERMRRVQAELEARNDAYKATAVTLTTQATNNAPPPPGSTPADPGKPTEPVPDFVPYGEMEREQRMALSPEVRAALVKQELKKEGKIK